MQHNEERCNKERFNKERCKEDKCRKRDATKKDPMKNMQQKKMCQRNMQHKEVEGVYCRAFQRPQGAILSMSFYQTPPLHGSDEGVFFLDALASLDFTLVSE